MNSSEKTSQESKDEKKHPLEILFEKHAKKLVIAFAACIVSFFIMMVINGIVATYIFGPIILIVTIVGMTLNLIVFASKVTTIKEFIFSQKIFNTLIVLITIVLAIYFGREQIKDVPYYLNKDFEVFVGSPSEIVVHRSSSGKGGSYFTYFILETGEEIIYFGKLEGLDPNHEYKIEYTPNAKQIIYVTDITTGEKWRHR